MYETIHVCGYASCSFFYRACVYASILKKRGVCKDYNIKGFDTRNEFFEWLENDSPISQSMEHRTSPLV